MQDIDLSKEDDHALQKQASLEAAPLIRRHQCFHYDLHAVKYIGDLLLRHFAKTLVGMGMNPRDPKVVDVLGEYIIDLKSLKPAPKLANAPAPKDIGVILSSAMEDFSQKKKTKMSRLSSWMGGKGAAEAERQSVLQWEADIEQSGFFDETMRSAMAQLLISLFDEDKLAWCGSEFPSANDLEEHKLDCPFRPYSCTNKGCSAVVAFKYKQRHDDGCQWKMVGCPLECGAFLRRKDVAKHVDGDCFNKQVQCPYVCIGCTHGDLGCKPFFLLQGNLPNHLKDSVNDHLLLAVTRVGELNGTVTQMQNKITKLESEMGRNTTALGAMQTGAVAGLLKFREDTNKKITSLNKDVAKLKTNRR